MTPALRARVLREWQPFGASPNIPTGSPASQLVPQVMKKLGLEQRLQQSQVFFLWPEIVGVGHRAPRPARQLAQRAAGGRRSIIRSGCRNCRGTTNR